ncbi:hypothetical protein SBA1_880011 [Candidatus Sulfotelmatobacter kueseliae]|uniref:Uncharacterized protein n=1 Tax=Candidatus Sulfotelmatobacter kueseliae TaxID=2042962 RepID=A0A2U3L9V3_9BACT|nr:hypothetical protein SBA1_880011 [Candidatus Sulfotelmatobacter kueseliae]
MEVRSGFVLNLPSQVGPGQPGVLPRVSRVVVPRTRFLGPRNLLFPGNFRPAPLPTARPQESPLWHSRSTAWDWFPVALCSPVRQTLTQGEAQNVCVPATAPFLLWKT